MTDLLSVLISVATALAGLVLLGVFLELVTSGWFTWRKHRENWRNADE